jgi:LmbE family N-acetylglucosaminyl deacetylase
MNDGAIVAIVAHPDDESLIAGGTLALAARRGLATGAVSLTRGEHGPIAGGSATRERLGEVREAELGEAAEILGLGFSACLHHPDGDLASVDRNTAARELAAILAEHGASTLLTFGDDGLYWHPDHIAAADIARRAAALLKPSPAVYAAAWPRGAVRALVDAAADRGLPHDLWGLEPDAFGWDTPATVSVDVRPVLPQKLSALRAHRTQLDAGHLLAALPLDLAERHLGSEPWAGPADGRLQAQVRG